MTGDQIPYNPGVIIKHTVVMKNQPDFTRPELLVLQVMQSFRPGEPLSVKKITGRFHERHGKSCSRWMVARGIMALVKKTSSRSKHGIGDRKPRFIPLAAK